MKKKIVDLLRTAWSNIKTTVSKIHITNAVQLIDYISGIAATIEPKVEALQKLEALAPIPEPYKAEIAAVLAAAIPVLKILANEPKLKHMYDDARLSLSTEVTNIMSGKVHDIAVIKADIQSIFSTEVSMAQAA